MAISTTGQIIDTRGTNGDYVVADTSAGALEVNAGSVFTVQAVSAATAEEEARLIIGRANVDPGGVLITGAGSRIDVISAGNATGHGGLVDVGRTGDGTLNIQQGGALRILDTVGTTFNYATGAGSETLNVGRGTGVGSQSGTLLVDAGSVLVNGTSANLNVGRDGATGAATLTSGSTLTLSSTIAAGYAALNVGRAGIGTMNVDASTVTMTGGGAAATNGGVDTYGAFINVGRDAGANGALTFRNNAQLTMSGDSSLPGTPGGDISINVGRAGGTGGFYVRSGSDVVLQNATEGTFIQVARNGSTGVATTGQFTVTDVGSTFTVNAPTSAFLAVGRGEGSSGELRVDNSAQMQVNAATDATLSLGNRDAGVTTGNGGIGTLALARNALLHLKSDGSTGTFSAGVFGGDFSGTGNIFISEGAELRITGGSTGTLNIGGNLGYERISLGTNGGNGNMVVESGGIVTISGTGAGLFAGGSGGTAGVDFTNATLNISSTIAQGDAFLTIGRGGTGNFTMAASTATVTGGGSANSGGNFYGAYLTVGRDAGGAGTATLINNSLLTLRGDSAIAGTSGSEAGINIGRNGGNGSLTVSSGADIVMEQSPEGAFINIGRNGSTGVATSGTLTVDGIGSTVTLNSPGSAFVGIGRGAGSTGQLSVTNGATMLVEGDAGASIQVGVRDFGVTTGNGGNGTVLVNGGSVLHLKNDGTGANQSAFLQLGSYGADSFVTVDGTGSVLRVTSATAGHVNMGHVFDAASPGQVLPGSGGLMSRLTVQSGGRIEMIDGTAENSFILGRGMGAAELVIQSGGVANLDQGDATGGAFMAVGSGVSTARSSVLVTGTGSRLEGVNSIIVGRNPFDTSSTAPVGGNGLFTVADGGAVVLGGSMTVGEGGRLTGHGGSITTNSMNSVTIRNNGTLGDDSGAIETLTVNGTLRLENGASWVVDVNSTTSDRAVLATVSGGGGQLFLGNVNANIKVTGGYQFAAGDTRVFVQTNAPGAFFDGFDNGGGGGVFINGQNADFSYYIGQLSSTTFGLQALNSGATGGVGTLDFGATETLGGNLQFFDPYFEATGGRFGLQGGSAVNVDKVQGTAGNDVFNASGLNSGPIMLEGRDGDDALTGGGFGDTLVGGKGNDSHSGGGGTDVVVFTGPVSEYGFSFNGLGQLVVTDGVTNRDGTDTILGGVENLSFNSVTMAIPLTTVTIVAADAVKAEGNAGSTALTFQLTRAGNTTLAQNVSYAVTGAAVTGADFTGGALPSGIVSFAAGETVKNLTINVAGDTAVEANENFTVTLSNPTNGLTLGSVGSSAASGTIQNDDAAGGGATISIAALSADKNEGNSGTTPFTFTVTRSGSTTGTDSVQYAVTSATADAVDFNGVLPSGAVTFNPGETSKTVTLSVTGDANNEADEAFTVTLSNPSAGVTIGTGTAGGTIRNDDAPSPGSISIGDASTVELNTGTRDYNFIINRTGGTGAFSVNFATSDGTATVAGNDYIAQSGTLNFADGETSKTITILGRGDTVVEPNETFNVTLSGGTNGVTITDALGVGTILNDDSAVSPPVIQIAPLSADKNEGNSGTTPFTFTVTRTGDVSAAGSVQWNLLTNGNPQITGSDFASGNLPSGTVNFAAGQIDQTITIDVVGDTAQEADETFSISLFNASAGSSIGTSGAANGIIRNDDAAAPVISIVALSADKAEGNSGSTPFTFTVTRAGSTAGTSTVDYMMTNGGNPQVTGSDFTGGFPTGTITFAPGETSKTLTINVAGETAFETDENFSINLTNPSAGTSISVTAGSAAAVIRNDDLPAPVASIVALSADKNEGNSGTTPFTFTVTRTGDPGPAFSVNWGVGTGGSANVGGFDFAGGLLPSGTISFASGETSKTLTVDVAGDTEFETDDTFTVSLTGPTNGVAVSTTAGSATGVIRNDDVQLAGSVSIADVSLAEGNVGTKVMTFTVTRTGGTLPFTVNYATIDGTAVSTGGNDYQAASGTLSFADGDTSKTISVTITGDTRREANETFTVRLSNGTGGVAIADADGIGTIVNDDANNLPTVNVANVALTRTNLNPLLSSMMSFTDIDGDTVTGWEVFDNTAGNGSIVVGGVAQPAQLVATLTTAQFATATFNGGAGSDSLWVRANDGTGWGAWANFTVTGPTNTAPTVTAPNAVLTRTNTNPALSTLMSATDAESDAITRWQFWDNTPGTGSFVRGGVDQSALTLIEMTATEFAGATFRAGTGTEQLFARAYDGLAWGDWVGFTVSPPVNSLPVVSAANVTLARNNLTPLLSTLVSATDGEGDPTVAWQFWDNTFGSGNIVKGGVVQGDQALIEMTASEFNTATFRSGMATDTLYVRANDGIGWGAWVAFTVSPPVNALPVVTAANTVLARTNTNPLLSTLISATDANGDSIATWQFWDNTIGAGHFTKGGVAQGDQQLIEMTAGEFATATFQGGGSTDSLWVRANDGFGWSGWVNFTVSPPVNSLPVVVAANTTLSRTNPNPSLSSLVSATDANGDAIAGWQFWDNTIGSGKIVKGGVAQGDQQLIEMTAAEFAAATFQGGGSLDSLWARANDGISWGEWKNFTVAPPTNTLPVVTAPNANVTRANLNPSLSSLVSATDADGDTVQTWQFWDATAGGGKVVKGGVAQADNTLVEMTAAEFAAGSFRASAGTDSLWVRANDGFGWTGWQNFAVTGPTNVAPTVSFPNAQFAGPGVSRNVNTIVAATDADGDAITEWQFWDNTIGGGSFAIGGASQPAQNVISMTAGQFASATFTAGATDDDVWVRSYDGFEWSAWTYARFDNLLA